MKKILILLAILSGCESAPNNSKGVCVTEVNKVGNFCEESTAILHCDSANMTKINECDVWINGHKQHIIAQQISIGR